MMDTLWQDVKYGARQLARSPGFTAVAVVTLALGIGANTALFSVVNAVLLKPLPFPESDRLVLLWQRSPQFNVMMVSYPDFLDYRAQNRVFEEIALYNRYQNRNLTNRGEPQRLSAAVVTSGVLRVLRIQPALGRAFLPAEDERDGTKVAILSHGLWQRVFGGDADVVGQTIVLDGEPFEVVGVLPHDLQFLPTNELWLPMGTFVSDNLMDRGNHVGMVGLARLKTGVSLEQARADMDRISRALEEQYAESNTGVGVAVNQMYEVRVGNTRPALFILLGAVGFVLLIACANVANLLLSRAVSRKKENAIRAAMGASSARLVRQWITESLVLALLGGGLGWVLSWWSVDALRWFGTNQVPRASEIRLDERVLAFTLLASVFTGVLVGLVSGLQSVRTNLNETLKETGRAHSPGRARSRLSGLLVVSEVALSFILLTGAGLLVWSFYRLQDVNPGFSPHNVLTMRLSLPQRKYPGDPGLTQFWDQLVERAQAVPGVEAAALTGNLPFSEDGWQFDVYAEGQPEPEPGKTPFVEVTVVSVDYFRVMNIPLVRGRSFTQEDRGASPVVIVSESFVRQFFPGIDPLGRRVREARPGAGWMTVVGVVGDTNRDRLDSRSLPELYMPYTQNTTHSMSLVVRTAVKPANLAAALREQVHAIDRDQPVYSVRTMEERVSASLGERRFSMVLPGGFAALAFVLAAVGLYGVVSYSVTQRTHEIGVRMALGAGRLDVLKLVFGRGMRLVLIGAALGALGALYVTRFVAKLLYGTQPTEPSVFLSVAILLMIVAFLACWAPARRAMRVDPMTALRYE